jgi:hypothetical protein
MSFLAFGQHICAMIVLCSAAALAIARDHGAGVMYSLHQAMLRAGTMLGLPVSMGIQ